MACQRPVLNKIRALLAGYDDTVLEALADRGLVRRARKDLEKEPPTLLDEDVDAMIVEVAGEKVRIPATITGATCSCPADTICRHILMAILFLKQLPPGDAPQAEAAPPAVSTDRTDAIAPPADTPAPPTAAARSGQPPPAATGLSGEDEAVAISDESLIRWAGKALHGRALRELASGIRAEPRGREPLALYLPAWNRTVTWIRGGGLEGTVCSCHAAAPCIHRVVAILSLRADRAPAGAAPQAPALEASGGAPRTREEVLESVRLLLEDMVALGFSRVAAATEQRFHTLAVSAHGVDLPRLERLLHALAMEIAYALGRDARSDSGSLLLLACRTEALRVALGNPSFALVGRHRTRYDLVGALDLIGMGARCWRTASGYHGLTVYFWNRAAADWATWSDSRPVQAAGFDPRKRFTEDGPWRGCESPDLASRSNLRLASAYRNREGRLSGRAATHAIVTGPSDLAAAGDPITRWSVLADRAARLFHGGLGDVPELANVVLLAPAAWGPPVFDEVRQELVREVVDADRASIPLALPHTPENALAVDLLERIALSPPARVLGLLLLRQQRLIVEPIAIHTGPTITSLTLAGAAVFQPQSTPGAGAAAGASAGAPAAPGGSGEPAGAVDATAAAQEEEVEEADEGPAPAYHSATPLGLLLVAAQSELARIAEGGIAAPVPLEGLHAIHVQMEHLGLTACGRAVGAFLDFLGEVRAGAAADLRTAAGALLRAYYVLSLASNQEALAGAIK